MYDKCVYEFIYGITFKEKKKKRGYLATLKNVKKVSHRECVTLVRRLACSKIGLLITIFFTIYFITDNLTVFH
jgi:hypothetical protein